MMDVPVIILSTSNDIGIQTKMKAAGASAYITKPDSLKKLIGILNFYLVAESIRMLG